MKTTTLLFVAWLAFSNIAFSQDSKTQAQKMTDKMKTNLSLTDEQAKEVLPINESFTESMAALKKSSEGKLAKYQKFKEADDQRDSALKKLLSKEQYLLFKEQKEENREALKEARKNRGN